MIQLQTISERIKQRRSQMLIHSYLYYTLDTSIISDHQWQKWADELTDLQHNNPTKIGFYDTAFEGWDGSTGMHLPKDQWVIDKANYLLDRHSKE